MYCPVCGAEYRPGFTECSDCQVALVAELARAQSGQMSPQSASYATIWSGDDPLKHAEIVEALDREEIPARTLNREDRSFNLVTQPAFEVFVPVEFLDAAHETLKQVAAVQDPEEPSGSGIFEIPADEDLSDEDYYGEQEEEEGRKRVNLDPQDASVEIWSGADADMANMITSSLYENDIACRRDPDPSNPDAADSESVSGQLAATRIFVFPEDERRAKEIVREILNAAPPQ
jgi:hypothetical protein